MTNLAVSRPLNAFVGILSKRVTYFDMEGNAHTLESGTAITVEILGDECFSSTLDGENQLEESGSFIGTFGNHSFDLSDDDFYAVN